MSWRAMCFMNKPRWYSVGESAQHLGIKPSTLYKWIERKQMPAHKVGRLWKFKLEELDEWVKSGKGAEDSKELDLEENKN